MEHWIEIDNSQNTFIRQVLNIQVDDLVFKLSFKLYSGNISAMLSFTLLENTRFSGGIKWKHWPEMG